MKWLAAAALVLAAVLAWQASRPKSTAAPLPRLITTGRAAASRKPAVTLLPAPEVAEK